LVTASLKRPALVAARTSPKANTIVYWIATALFCLQMSFTAYAQLRLPQVAEAFTHLGFPVYFRVELSCAKLLGVALMLAPVPTRLKEWAYAGFAIDLASALIAHVAVGDGPGGFTCPVANVDPKTATPAEIARARKVQTGYQVDGITGGLAVKDKAKDQKASDDKIR
jgi:hypothetical protein